jgi:hypothetical protein
MSSRSIRKSLLALSAELLRQLSDVPVSDGGGPGCSPDKELLRDPRELEEIGGRSWQESAILGTPFAAPNEAVLSGPIDAVNCGDFSFSLYTAQLLVSMLGTGGAVGGEYSVPSLPVHMWTRLLGRDGSPLPILVLRDHGAIVVRVGSMPDEGEPAATPTR